jgi:zinc/manganese transport system permease protein
VCGSGCWRWHSSARFRLPAAYAVGFAGYVLGLLASALYDFPTGAAIVCLLAAVGASAAVVLGRAPCHR